MGFLMNVFVSVVLVVHTVSMVCIVVVLTVVVFSVGCKLVDFFFNNFVGSICIDNRGC